MVGTVSEFKRQLLALLKTTVDPRFEYLYLLEIESQCWYAINAYKYLNIQLGLFSHGPSCGYILDPKQEIFRSVHSFVTHTGNISKLLWPGTSGPGPNKKDRKKRMEDRAHHLRQVLDLPDQGHQLESREIRNYLEHFDEDLDTWATDKTGRGLVALDNLGPFGMTQGDAINYVRCFDTKSHELLFLDKKVNLRCLNETLENLTPLVTRKKESALTSSRNKQEPRDS